jgi:hypothetical protein
VAQKSIITTDPLKASMESGCPDRANPLNGGAGCPGRATAQAVDEAKRRAATMTAAALLKMESVLGIC